MLMTSLTFAKLLRYRLASIQALRREVGSGKETLAAAVDWQPDVILCDVTMPVMDGPAMLMRLRKNALTAAA